MEDGQKGAGQFSGCLSGLWREYLSEEAAASDTFSVTEVSLCPSGNSLNPADWRTVASWVKRRRPLFQGGKALKPDSFVAICMVGNIL